jgi:putative transposase
VFVLGAALGVSRSGFHALLGRSPSARSRSDEVLASKVRASFVGSDRTYGARRVWHDVLAEGHLVRLHRIERLMRAQALRARPRRRRRPAYLGEDSSQHGPRSNKIAADPGEVGGACGRRGRRQSRDRL